MFAKVVCVCVCMQICLSCTAVYVSVLYFGVCVFGMAVYVTVVYVYVVNCSTDGRIYIMLSAEEGKRCKR